MPLLILLKDQILDRFQAFGQFAFSRAKSNPKTVAGPTVWRELPDLSVLTGAALEGVEAEI